MPAQVTVGFYWRSPERTDSRLARAFFQPEITARAQIPEIGARMIAHVSQIFVDFVSIAVVLKTQ